MSYGILIDLTRCIGCKACVWACKEMNDLPRDDDGSTLSATTWTSVNEVHGVNVKRQCMHCEDPACVSVCPVGALQKTAAGPVVYDEDRCIGCRYCMVSCPFDIPKYEWSSRTPVVRKCGMCFEKAVSSGEQPACTAACPTGASMFGDRDDLVLEARNRLRAEPERYFPHIFGLEEAGGTSVLYLSPVPMEELGFPKDLCLEPYPMLTWRVLSKLPNVASLAGTALLGVWWITRRREEVAAAEGATSASSDRRDADQRDEDQRDEETKP